MATKRSWTGWNPCAAAACAALVAGLLLAVGVVAGYFIHQSVTASKAAPMAAAGSAGSMPELAGSSSTPEQHGNDGWRAALVQPTAGGAGTGTSGSPHELPPTGSAAAQQLLSNPTTPGHIIKQYTWFSDNTIITGEKTAEFLRHLQAQLQTSREQISREQGTTAMAPAIDLAPFIRVALDLLRFLRAHDGEVLLRLLREFSASGRLALDDVSPDALQAEVNALLASTQQLNAWYSVALVRDEAGHGSGDVHQEPVHTEAAADTSPAAASGHRRLLALKRHHARRVRAAASIPEIAEDAVDGANSGPLPTASPSQTLQDMLCSVRSFSPTGVEGLALPPSGAKAGAKPAPVACDDDALPAGYFQAGAVRFRPVVIPVVFHCLRFEADGVLQPPLFDAAVLGQYLIDTTNQLYKATGIQFKLEGVRHNPTAHPYLSVASLDDWKACTANNKQARKYKFPCLSDVVGAMTDPPSAYAINVFVSGSMDETSGLCGDRCPNLFLGYAKALGPWQEENAISASWTEDAPRENFVALSWDMFAISGDTTIADPALTRDSGAVTLAHELGHYLGLRHTFAGHPNGCSGDGLAATDAVPDTPANQVVNNVFSGRLADLAGWCADFKAGKAPAAAELLAYNSCGASDDGHVDNVFNVMSYIPDACVMVFSPNQVARMQWAIASFRPGLMAAHAV